MAGVIVDIVVEVHTKGVSVLIPQGCAHDDVFQQGGLGLGQVGKMFKDELFA